MRTIRGYLTVLVLGAMLPGALLTAALVWRALANNRAAAERGLLDSARVDARALDRQFESTIVTLQALATSPALTNDDVFAFYNEARRVQATQADWYTVMLMSADERQLMSTRLAWGTPLMPSTELGSLRLALTTRQPAVGPIRRSPRGGDELLYAVRVPVVRDGVVRYVLSAVVDARSLERLVPPQTADSQEWTRAIIDPDGTIAVRTRGGGAPLVGTRATPEFLQRVRAAPERVSSETTREGVPAYAATSRTANGWTTIVVVPRSSLDQPLRTSLTGVLTGGVLLMLCGLAAVIVISRRLAHDIEAAAVVAEAVAQNRPTPENAPRLVETARLQHSLTATVALLESQARALQSEVQRADAARTEAEEASRTKDQFLAVLGHELRNPLAPALTAVELMKMRDPAAFTRERQILERQLRHMTRLVNDLLDVSRLARGKVDLTCRRIELSDVVGRAVDMAQPLIRQQQHELTVSVPSGLIVDADMDRLVQVFSNLLTNAAKYTPAGGHIVFTASVDGDRVSIACEDDGPGVSDDLRPTLFEPFAQGPRDLDRREGGLGLGLALARIFTERHGGTLVLERATRGKGARFVITLPLAQGETTTSAVTSEPSTVASTPKRLLVVEDNDDACEMMRASLSDAGHDVTVARDGPQAIAFALESHPEVAILDIGLPGMDGYELARQLRERMPALRLIAVTGYGQASDREDALNAGFHAHQTKPVTTAALLECIERVAAPQHVVVPR